MLEMAKKRKKEAELSKQKKRNLMNKKGKKV